MTLTFFSTDWIGERWLHALWIGRCALDKNCDFAGDSRVFFVASLA